MAEASAIVGLSKVGPSAHLHAPDRRVQTTSQRRLRALASHICQSSSGAGHLSHKERIIEADHSRPSQFHFTSSPSPENTGRYLFPNTAAKSSFCDVG